MQLIDSHCHLDFSDFEDDLISVIKRANQHGIDSFIVPGVAKTNWSKVTKLTQRFDNVYCAYGIHPLFLKDSVISESEQNDGCFDELTVLENLLQNEPCIAVGECGLDATVDNMPLQQQVFKAQIELANKYNKPLIVHHRKTHHLIQQCFKQSKPLNGGVIHAFSGNRQEAQKYIELGFKLGVGGGVTYVRATKTRATIIKFGLSHIVLETDSPDMPLSGQQGTRNEPKNIYGVAKALAELLECSIDDVATTTTENVKRLFSL